MQREGPPGGATGRGHREGPSESYSLSSRVCAQSCKYSIPLGFPDSKRETDTAPGLKNSVKEMFCSFNFGV